MVGCRQQRLRLSGVPESGRRFLVPTSGGTTCEDCPQVVLSLGRLMRQQSHCPDKAVHCRERVVEALFSDVTHALTIAMDERIALDPHR